ncbi:hypothetical protein Pint_19790 [Pistacia integerrima]|uniref:Uncharacterized protein n=1 Tax=Pistacia integerrima TaxID=434235 RepID=A0ACC0XA92_9ROSI|nr:hypothetical protein Pint_19790 [Pistacia integerrima]
MGREGIQNIQLVEGNTSNLQTNLTDQGSRRDLRRSYLDKNLGENESGETGLLYGRAKDQNLRFRSRSKQVIDHEDAEQGELQSAVPVPVPNHEHQMSEDVSIWSTLWLVVKGYLGFCLAGQFHRSFAITSFVLKAILSLGYLLIGEYFPLHLILVAAFLDLIEIILTICNCHNNPLEILFFSSVQLIVTCSHFLLDYHKPSKPDDLRVQIDEDHHESLQSDFRRSPDDLASRVSETDRQTLRYSRKITVIIAFDFGYQNKELTYSSFVFTMQREAEDKERSTRLPDERPIANVELLFSGIQLLTTLLHLIFELKGVDDKKEHENGIHNGAEPPAEIQVNHNYLTFRSLRVNIYFHVHMRVTGKLLNKVIDLTMVTCYEQLFRKLGDEMFQAEKALWGDRPRWNVLYVDISDEAHYLREDEISWDEFCMAATEICIYRKEVRKELYRRWESMPRTSLKGSERALFT